MVMEETIKEIMEYINHNGKNPDKLFLPFDKWQKLKIEPKERCLPKTIVLSDGKCDHTNFLFMNVPICIEPSTITKEAFLEAAW